MNRFWENVIVFLSVTLVSFLITGAVFGVFIAYIAKVARWAGL
jgi:hypothetical protein